MNTVVDRAPMKRGYLTVDGIVEIYQRGEIIATFDVTNMSDDTKIRAASEAAILYYMRGHTVQEILSGIAFPERELPVQKPTTSTGTKASKLVRAIQKAVAANEVTPTQEELQEIASLLGVTAVTTDVEVGDVAEVEEWKYGEGNDAE